MVQDARFGGGNALHPLIMSQVWVLAEEDKVFKKVMHRLRDKEWGERPRPRPSEVQEQPEQAGGNESTFNTEQVSSTSAGQATDQQVNISASAGQATDQEINAFFLRNLSPGPSVVQQQLGQWRNEAALNGNENNVSTTAAGQVTSQEVNELSSSGSQPTEQEINAFLHNSNIQLNNAAAFLQALTVYNMTLSNNSSAQGQGPTWRRN